MLSAVPRARRPWMKILVIDDHVLIREAMRGVLRELKGEAAAAARAPPAPAKAGASAADIGLTERQMEVLALLMQGKSNKAISRVLDLAEPTVTIHVSAILKALKVANRTEAVIAATALGL